MLTSFFGKSSPINFLILICFVFLGLLLHTFLAKINGNVEIAFINIEFASILVLMLVSMLLLDFIIKKNSLSKKNTYGILFFSCFLVLMPTVFDDFRIVLSNVFILLAVRRMISLGNDKNSQKKILDAGLWITVAGLFYFYAFLFFLPLFISVIQKPNADYKQLLIPFIGFFAVVIINTALQLLLGNSFLWLSDWSGGIGLDFSAYNHISVLVPAAIIITYLVWTAAYGLTDISLLSTKERQKKRLVLNILFVSIIVALCAREKTGSEMLFILAPLSIVATNYIESRKFAGIGKQEKGEFWFKEILLDFLLLFAIISFWL